MRSEQIAWYILTLFSVTLMSLGVAGLIYLGLVWIQQSIEFWVVYWQTQGSIWFLMGWKGTRKYYAAKRKLSVNTYELY